MLNSLHSGVNQELFEKRLCNQGSQIWTVSVTQRKPSHATTKLTLLTDSKDEWDTKQDTGKSMKNALCILRMPSWAEATSNSEKKSSP